MQIPIKCKRNYVVLINRYLWVSLCILILLKKIEDILRKFSEIMGKYRILHENLWGLNG